LRAGGRAVAPGGTHGGMRLPAGTGLRGEIASGRGAGRTLPMAFAAVLPVAFTRRETRRQACFYAVAVALFTALGLDGPIQRFYLALPFGSFFRWPARFLWLAAFGGAMLTGLGADALA